jgi:hypothetical protein
MATKTPPQKAKTQTTVKPATQTAPQAETPFKVPGWPWNYVPFGGMPTRTRCQSIVSAKESETGTELIRQYREQEVISASNDVEGFQLNLSKLDQAGGPGAHGVERKKIRKQIEEADHDLFLLAEARKAEFRKEAAALARTLLKKFIKVIDDELNETAIATEQRLDRICIPIKQGEKWALHEDAICCALWSQRHIAEKILVELHAGTSIGAVQFFCTDEEKTPFQWLS